MSYRDEWKFKDGKLKPKSDRNSFSYAISNVRNPSPPTVPATYSGHSSNRQTTANSVKKSIRDDEKKGSIKGYQTENKPGTSSNGTAQKSGGTVKSNGYQRYPNYLPLLKAQRTSPKQANKESRSAGSYLKSMIEERMERQKRAEVILLNAIAENTPDRLKYEEWRNPKITDTYPTRSYSSALAERRERKISETRKLKEVVSLFRASPSTFNQGGAESPILQMELVRQHLHSSPQSYRK